jgi:1,4-alpha-glucan branching enzyme
MAPSKSDPVQVPQQITLAVDPNYFKPEDIHLIRQGKHYRLYNLLGAHPWNWQGQAGTYFAVWVPNAKSVSVLGDFNQWRLESHVLNLRSDQSGIWEGFIPHVQSGNFYKYHIQSNQNGSKMEKSDPFAFYNETPPKTASAVWDLGYQWNDEKWMRHRQKVNAANAPISIYEVHLGSWHKLPDSQNNEFRSYRELADSLVSYVKNMGYTHVELMPVMEHPFYGSWGYQTLGYYSPSTRYGTPQDFMCLVDSFHQAGIGVLLDWVPSHFPSDEHGLARFDGTNLYEVNGAHPDWNTSIFNNGRWEVIDFLISNALFWMDKYHVDGLRVDAVASMLYLDYSRKEGQWTPNIYGGRENLESIEFLHKLNNAIKEYYPDVKVIAEESTSWPQVSKPVSDGGLGFDMKWNMGWMHDTLYFFGREDIHRQYHMGELTFSLYYAFHENFVLSLSHDEVVHGKSSLIGKMPGANDDEKFANLRCLFGYMYGYPGKKLLFMGQEFAQRSEWDHDGSLQWDLLQYGPHKGVQELIRDLNFTYRHEKALHESDFIPQGFYWVDTGNCKDGIVAFIRRSLSTNEKILIICNLKNIVWRDYTIGALQGGAWGEIFNSDDRQYGGSGLTNPGVKQALRLSDEQTGFSNGVSHHKIDQAITVNIPPLSTLMFKNIS